MSVALKLRTFKALIDKVQSFPGVTKNELLERIEREIDNDYSVRTLQRDLKSLNIDFGICITYDHIKRGYVLDAFDKSNSEFLDQSFSLLNSYNSLKELSANSSIVDLSMNSSELMNPVFPILVEAIKREVRVFIKHKKNIQAIEKEYEISPLFFKEYNYKWYLIAAHDGVIKSYGIKRISEVEQLEGVAIRDLFGEAKEKLYNCVGVSYLNKCVETISFAATIQQAIFLDQDPIHHSQEKIKIGSEVAIYRLRVVINDELKMKIMSYGTTVRILEPSNFKKWFHDVASVIKENVDQENLNLDNANRMFG